jgi:phosphoribosylamine--glycine ligase/phosphoribosylformylglycinamidine cyclo-ligase
MAHITGGGFVENVPRALPRSLGARIDVGKWALPPVFRWVMRAGAIVPGEMVRTFNCGIGMVLVVAADKIGAAVQALEKAGQKEVYTIGEVVGLPGVEILNTDLWKE